MKTLIKNVQIITMNTDNEVINNGFIIFDSNGIIQIAPMSKYDSCIFNDRCYEIIDGKNKILMPGMCNIHSHLGMVPFRGLGDDCPDRLRRILLPMEKAYMTKEIVYASSKFAFCELLLSGVTTICDMYYFEEFVARAAKEAGIRAFLGETIMSEPTCDSLNATHSLTYTEDFINRWKDDPLITPIVAPHSTITCTENELRQANEISEAYNVPITMHVAELDYETDYFIKNYKQTPVEYLENIGLLSPRLLAAHCINVNTYDLNKLKFNDTKIVHCIGSNTKAAKGIAPIKAMLDMGLCVALGTDGPASGNTLDIITQLKLFANFHKNENRQRSIFPCNDILKLGTLSGAKALNINHKIGSIEEGKQADLVLVETTSPNMYPIYNPATAIVYSAHASNVDSVFVAGKQLVKSKKLVNLDLDQCRVNLRQAQKNFTKGAYQLKAF